MNNLIGNIGHITTALVVIVATVVLALHGTITGDQALVVIAGAGGFSLGGSVASSPGSAPAPTPAPVAAPAPPTSPPALP